MDDNIFWLFPSRFNQSQGVPIMYWWKRCQDLPMMHLFTLLVDGLETIKCSTSVQYKQHPIRSSFSSSNFASNWTKFSILKSFFHNNIVFFLYREIIITRGLMNHESVFPTTRLMYRRIKTERYFELKLQTN